MKKKNLLLFAGLFALAAVLTALGQSQSQTQSPTQPQPQDAQSQPQSSGMSSDNSTDIQGRKRYLVGPGDLLDVRVFGQSDLNSTVEIDDEGNISSLPFLETPIPAMCRNEKDIQKTIALAYSKYLKNPRVSVRVTERRSRPPAVVFGAVRAPQRIQMMRRFRLHEVLVAAGGIALNASGTIQIIHTERDMCPQDANRADLGPDKPVITSAYEKAPATVTSDKPAVTPVSNRAAVSPFVGATTTASSDKQTQKPAATAASDTAADKNSDQQLISDIGQIQTYQIGDTRQGLGNDDPYIRPGDYVIVTEGEPVYINGYVNAPREIVMKDGMTLGRAIAMAGGIQKTAKGSAVRVYRQEKGRVGPKVIKVDYNAIRDGGPDFLLQPYDIVDVRPTSMVSPASLTELFKGIAKGSMGGMAGQLPYRILY